MHVRTFTTGDVHCITNDRAVHYACTIYTLPTHWYTTLVDFDPTWLHNCDALTPRRSTSRRIECMDLWPNAFAALRRLYHGARSSMLVQCITVNSPRRALHWNNVVSRADDHPVKYRPRSWCTISGLCLLWTWSYTWPLFWPKRYWAIYVAECTES